tara:strand:+ start:7604 stop:7858 length:255 start_codon:yes stop_codon:yes gene_type:complete
MKKQFELLNQRMAGLESLKAQYDGASMLQKPKILERIGLESFLLAKQQTLIINGQAQLLQQLSLKVGKLEMSVDNLERIDNEAA